MSAIKVCVIGAGVIGLSSAVQILENIPGVKVTVNGGLEITEPILITDNGHECLCKTPRELFIKV